MRLLSSRRTPYVNAFESAPSPIGFASSAAFRGPPRWVESSCARPTDELDSVAWTVQEVLSLTPGTLHGIPAALPRFPMRILCAYSFWTHDIFNKTSPGKNVGTRLDNFTGAAALQVNVERKSRWTWFVLRFRCLGTFPEAWKIGMAQPCRYR